MSRKLAAVIFLLPFISIPAHAGQICAWMIETNEPNDVRHLEVWLHSDAETDFYYKFGGQGIVNGMGHSHSPSKGTFSLHAGQTDSPWSFGATLDAPAKIDVTLELHQTPADIFSDAPTPLIARFLFQRNVPETEKTPPKTLAKKQCAPIAATAQ